jgi:predicted extracellular nuclease
MLAGAAVDALSYEGNTAGSTEGTGTTAADSNSEANVGLSRCPDGTDTNDNDADFVLAPITPGATNICGPPPPDPVGNCGEPATRIHAVQGNGTATPVNGTAVTIEGVVTGDYQGTGQFNGYFVQEEVADQDADSMTSEGIFVFSGSSGVQVDAGDVVRVRGTAGEFGGMTQLSSVTGVAECATGASVPATPVSLPVASSGDHEAFEGMLVEYTQTLTATEVFNLGRFGEVSLSGVGRLYNPTAVAAPGAPAHAVNDQNDRSRIVLDDASNTQNNDPTLYPQGGLSATNTLRVGDTLPGLTGVLEFRFSAYRIQPVGPVAFEHTNLRPAAPAAVGGNLKIASFNVLNYFDDLDLPDGSCPTCRGAESELELERQEAKIVSALKAIDADIVGLMEIENDGGPGNALADLTTALNEATAPGTYAYVDTGAIGTDAIKVALIYKPAAAVPVGDWEILTTADDPRFDDTRNRPALAQTFRHLGSGEALTVVVNHLKSKGSGCGPGDDATDESGNCNGTRTLAAAALADWIATDPTGSGDHDFMIIGDLNAYTFETPITTLEAAGYTNLVRKYGGLTAYSYVFQGESGYLDHALATSSLEAQVTGTTIWHINPDEPTVLDYNTEF